MINLIDFYVEWLNNVLMYELKVFMSDPMFDVSSSTSEEIVDHNYLSRNIVIMIKVLLFKVLLFKWLYGYYSGLCLAKALTSNFTK